MVLLHRSLRLSKTNMAGWIGLIASTLMGSLGDSEDYIRRHKATHGWNQTIFLEIIKPISFDVVLVLFDSNQAHNDMTGSRNTLLQRLFEGLHGNYDNEQPIRNWWHIMGYISGMARLSWNAEMLMKYPLDIIQPSFLKTIADMNGCWV